MVKSILATFGRNGHPNKRGECGALRVWPSFQDHELPETDLFGQVFIVVAQILESSSGADVCRGLLAIEEIPA